MNLNDLSTHSEPGRPPLAGPGKRAFSDADELVESTAVPMEFPFESTMVWSEEPEPDHSWLGEFVDTPREGAIDLVGRPDRNLAGLPRFWIPAHRRAGREHEWAERCGGIEAARAAMIEEDYQEHMRYRRNAKRQMMCTVTARHGGLAATHSLRAIPDDGGARMLETVRECREQALRKLREKIIKRLSVE